MSGNLWRIGLLVLVLSGCGLYLVQVPWQSRLQTDVSALLTEAGDDVPGTGEAALEGTLQQAQSRLLFFRLAQRPEAPAEALIPAADALLARLRAQPGLAAAGQGQGLDEATLQAWLWAHRYALLLPAWLQAQTAALDSGTPPEAWGSALARASVADLGAFLASPEAWAWMELVPEDPLLLVAEQALQAFDSAVFSQASPADAGANSLLLWAEVAPEVNPFEASGIALNAALEGHVADVAAETGADVAWTGVLRYASASRTAIRAEVGRLNALSLGLVTLLACLLLRRPWALAGVLVPALTALAIGLTTVALAFEGISILSLVLGSVLAGIAIDYGTHRLLHGGAGEAHASGLRRGLLLSAVTSIAGFSLLLFSSAEVLRQTGAFVASGLLGALAVTLLWQRPSNPQGQALVRGEALLTRPVLPPLHRRGRSRAAGLALGAVPVIACVWLALGAPPWHDDPRVLDIPQPELERDRARVLSTDGPGLLFAYGAGALDALEAAAGLEALARPGQLNNPWGALLPDAATAAALARLEADWPGFQAAMAYELAREGYDAEAFADFLNQAFPWSPQALEGALAALEDALQGPARLLLATGTGGGPARVALLREDVPVDPDWEARPGIYLADVRGRLNAFLGSYRAELLRFALAGMAVMALLLVVSLRGAGLWILSAPLNGVALTLAALPLLAGHLHLFHLLGAFLGFCLSLDYAIFQKLGQARGHYPPSIRFSGVTTVGAFGVLTTSAIPAVAGLGLAVLGTVLVALVLLECLRALSHAPVSPSR